LLFLNKVQETPFTPVRDALMAQRQTLLHSPSR
jgi:hypothetical protein